ncbi:MAG: response regulator, partial [Pedobacter sp.]
MQTEALSYLKQHPVSLIVLDLNFSIETSGREGMQLLQEIRKINGQVPVILITGWGSIDLAVEGMKNGASDFITKPWSNDHVLQSVKTLYLVIGSVIAALGIAFSFVKVPPLTDPHVIATDTYAIGGEIHVEKKLFQHKHFVFAAIAQFFNVAAQGGTWAFFINYGHEIVGLSDKTAANYFAFSMVMMMLGRFAGTALMRFIKPYKLLAIFATANIVMCIIVAQGFGWPSFIALLFINFFFSIMFPTIFSLGLKDLGSKTQQASSFISMGVVGGAVFPFLMGYIGDHYSVAHAYYAPIICYAVIFMFGYKFYKVKHH